MPVAVRHLCLLASWALMASSSALAGDLAGDQREIAERYRRLEALALRIADLADKDDAGRADQIRAAIGDARSLGVEQRFDAVVRMLEQERFAAARGGQTELADQLQSLLGLITADPAESRLEAERERLEELRREIGKAIRTQRSLRARAERIAAAARPVESQGGEVAEEQTGLADRIARLAEFGDPRQPPREGGEPISSRLGAAEEAMRDASRQIAAGRSAEGVAEQRRAQEELEAAARMAERALRQLREEEQQRRLAGLSDRLRAMLKEQQAVVAGLKELGDSASVDRRTRLAARRLEQRQTDAADAADRALRLIEEDGRSLVFAEVMRQTAVDMHAVASRLAEIRLGAFTLGLAEGVVASLEEMLAAVDRALDESQRRQDLQQAGGVAGGGEPGLISSLGELRMLRSVQSRLLRRTRQWRDAGLSGDVTAGELREGLARLAAEQGRLAESARHTAELAESR